VQSGRELVEAARAHVAARRWAEAVHALEEARRLDDGDPRLAIALVRLYCMMGHTREALPIAAKLAEGAPEDPQRLVLYGQVLVDRDRHEDAWRAFKKAIDLAPDTPEAWLGQASVAYARRQLRLAQDLLRRMLSLRPGDPKGLAMLSDVRADSEAHEALVEECRRTLAEHPDWADWHFKLGGLLVEDGLDEEALACFDRALAINPGYSKARYHRGHLRATLGRHVEALDDLKACFQTASVAFDADRVLSACEHEADGDLEQAIKEYQAAIRLEPDYASQHIELGKRFYEAGLIEQAERELALGLSLRDDYADGHYTLGSIKRERGDRAGAIQELKAAVAAAPGFVDALIALAQVSLEEGLTEAARSLLAQARLKRRTPPQDERITALEARVGIASE
jgi:tetratricopeptide (TPR) repeat protein